MKLIRMIVFESMTWNVRLFAKHVSTKDNYFADALSRNQLDRFWQLAREDNKLFSNKLRVPSVLWPLDKVW